MKNTNITISFLLISAAISFLIGAFVGCGAQRKGESVNIDTVYKDKIIVKNSVPRLIDSIPYSRPQQNGSSGPTRLQSRELTGTPRQAGGITTGNIGYTTNAPTAESGPAHIYTDTFHSDNLTISILDTVSENRIAGRQWFVHDTRPVIRETRTTEKKPPLFSLYGGAHATNMPAGTFYGPDAALSIRNNAFIYCNYTFVQNTTQLGVLLRLSK